MFPKLISFNSGQLTSRAKSKNVNASTIDENSGLFYLLYNFFQKISDECPHLLVSHGYKEALVACTYSILKGTAWVHVYHGVSENYSGWKSIKEKLYLSVLSFLVKIFSKKIIFVSKDTREKLGFSLSNKSKIIYNSAPALEVSSHSNQEIKLAWIGRLVTVKRPELALNIIQQCHIHEIKVSIDFAGTGPLYEELKEVVKSLNIEDSVFFPWIL